MKRLLHVVMVVLAGKLSAQSFPVKKVNDEYVLASLKGSEKFKDNISEVLRDNKGLYWVQNRSEVSSYDGVNWKTYQLKNANNKSFPILINEIEATDDGNLWLGTSEAIFVFDPASEIFIPIRQKFPAITGMPLTVNCICKGIKNFLFLSVLVEGFYIYDWKFGTLKHVIIDSANKTYVPNFDNEMDVTVDELGNYWGLTKNNKGVWKYNASEGKINCSWKNELPGFEPKKYWGKNITGITYSKKENALWLAYGPNGILEKKYLSNGKTSFYTFSEDLKVKPDTSTKKRHKITTVKTDNSHNEWVAVGGKYLVKLNESIDKFEYLINDPELLPIGELGWLKPESLLDNGNTNHNNNLLWLSGSRGLSVLKKRNPLVRQIPFDSLSIGGITPEEYINRYTRQNIFFEKGNDNNYFLLQQDAGRPKLIHFNNNLQITKTLFNNEWKQYPAYFNTVFNPDSFYIAIMRKDIEPLDFRTVVIKDFKVDLKTFKTYEVNLNFNQRVWRYGSEDATGVYWLFSNGNLYSYNPKKDLLDSIYVCEPGAKGSYELELVKWFDYPTLLHKNSSTFWISFVANKELYKINLGTKKVDTIFRCCFDKKDCTFPSMIVDLYSFDSANVYLQFGFHTMLLNAKNNSITDLSGLFKNKLPVETQMGSGIYKNWICNVTSSEVNLLNIVSGQQKRLMLNEDFKWKLSQFNSRPLMNDRGEMILMSSEQKGFVVFNIDSVLAPPKPGTVGIAFVKLDNNYLDMDSLTKKRSLSLKYNKYNSLHFGISDFTVFDQDKISYEYVLYNGGDTVWNKIEGDPELTFTKISPGNYKLLIRAGNSYGDYSSALAVFNLSIKPPFTQTGWFLLLLLVAVAAILYAIYWYRVQQFYKLQSIRNNIASDLHDDIGSTLNSISIYSEVARQQAGKDIPALDLIGENSRKITESMSDIVWTINPENDSFEKIIVRMRSFAHQLLKAKKVEYTFEADEKLNSIALPMQVRKNFYLVFKEAITNLIKYSGATKVSINLSEENKIIILKIRDNGIGIPINPETQGNGLMNMKRRADEIHADLNIMSNGEGTGIELMLKT